MKKLVMFIIVVACLAVSAVPAVGQEGPPYGKVAGATQQQDGGAGGGPGGRVAATDSGESGTLPFTGLGLGLMLGAGMLLLGTGLVLRRARTTE